MEEIEQLPCKKESFEKSDIEIKRSPIHRYGVFAIKDIATQKIIEECSLIVFDKLKLEHRTAIHDRAFYWDDNHHAIALGYGCMYNHAEQPNAEAKIDYQNQILRFTAIRHIPAGTEILINYGSMWFSSRDKKPLIIKPQKDSNASFQIILLLLLLAILSKIFPISMYHAPTDKKIENQKHVLTKPNKL